MASIVEDISHDGDYMHLPSVDKEDADDYTDLPSQEEEEVEEEEEEEEQEEEEKQEKEEEEEEEDEQEEDGPEYIRLEDFVAFVLSMDFGSYILADIIEAQDAAASTSDATPSIGVAGASDDSELGEALETVEAPSDGRDCPICLQDDDTAAWKETPCGHRFHGRCVERWLQAKGSCPMCRSQLVATIPTAAATSTAPEMEQSVFVDFYDRVIASSALTEEE
jgi:hypothetical protein